jgi:nucleotide-binding universal stress UspA family protein
VSTGVLYLLAVLLVATLWGLRLGLLTGLAGAVAFNDFHIPPTSRLTVSEAPDAVALFPFVGDALSEPVFEATLRLARAEHATLVPAFLVRVPMAMPLAAPIPRQCQQALPLLEAVEQRAARAGVPVDSRIERGRTYRHALRELLGHEHFDRVVVAADTEGGEGFGAADVAWLLEHADGEMLVLRPAHDHPVVVASAA